jgi:hypothetical protein
MVQKYVIIYGMSFLFFAAGYFLLRNGLRKTDFKSAMEFVNYHPSRNYGKGYSIALGILCIIGGFLILSLKPK